MRTSVHWDSLPTYWRDINPKNEGSALVNVSFLYVDITPDIMKAKGSLQARKRHLLLSDSEMS